MTPLLLEREEEIRPICTSRLQVDKMVLQRKPSQQNNGKYVVDSQIGQTLFEMLNEPMYG